MRALLAKILFTVLTVCLPLFGHAYELAEIQAAVTADLVSIRQELDPQWRFYHYFTPTALQLDVATPESRSLSAQQRMHIAMDFFWNQESGKREKEAAGRGLYASIDPLASRFFGDTLLVLSVKPEAGKLYFLPANATWSVATISMLQSLRAEADCEMYPRPKIKETLTSMLAKGCDHVRKVILQGIVDAKIVGAEYGYTSTADAVCHTSVNRSAFVFFGEAAYPGLAGIAKVSNFEANILRHDLKNLSDKEGEESLIVDKMVNMSQTVALTVVTKANLDYANELTIDEKIDEVRFVLKGLDSSKRSILLNQAFRQSKLNEADILGIRSRIFSCQ